MPTRRNLGEIFSLLRRTSPSRPAYTTGQIREIMAGARTNAPGRPVRRIRTGRTLMIVAMMATLSGALIFWFAGRSVSPAGKQGTFAGTSAVPESMALNGPGSSGDTTARTTAEGGTRRGDSTEKRFSAKGSPGSEAIASPDTASMAMSVWVWPYQDLEPAHDSARATPRRFRVRPRTENMPQYLPASRTTSGTPMLNPEPEELERRAVKRTREGLELVAEERYAITNLRMNAHSSNTATATPEP